MTVRTKAVVVTGLAQSGTVLAAAVLFTAMAGTQAAASVDPSCADVEVVFARGTNEAPGVGLVGQAFVDALNSRMAGTPAGVYAVNYPASYDFASSTQGVVDAAHQIESIAAVCPHTRIVLGGYSQGAAVAGYTVTDTVPPGYVLPGGISGPLPSDTAQHIAAVILFATPAPWVVGLADHEAPPMSIAPMYAAKTLQLCAPGDPICSPGGLDRAAHSVYAFNGMADQAADFVVQAI
ncbi:cutinase family protein [soil metagenome]